jgi:hypothetical protein
MAHNEQLHCHLLSLLAKQLVAAAAAIRRPVLAAALTYSQRPTQCMQTVKTSIIKSGPDISVALYCSLFACMPAPACRSTAAPMARRMAPSLAQAVVARLVPAARMARAAATLVTVCRASVTRESVWLRCACVSLDAAVETLLLCLCYDKCCRYPGDCLLGFCDKGKCVSQMRFMQNKF